MIRGQTRQEFVQSIPIFAGLNARALTVLAQAADEVTFRPGDIVVKEGDPGDRMFVIHSGRVEIVKHLGETCETVLAVFESRDFVGEMSIIECVTRCASIRAVEETELLVLKSTDLYRLYRSQPDQYAIVILNIARDLSRRLRRIDELFTATSH